MVGQSLGLEGWKDIEKAIDENVPSYKRDNPTPLTEAGFPAHAILRLDYTRVVKLAAGMLRGKAVENRAEALERAYDMVLRKNKDVGHLYIRVGEVHLDKKGVRALCAKIDESEEKVGV